MFPAHQLKNLEHFFTLKDGVVLYAGLKTCHQLLPSQSAKWAVDGSQL